MKKRTDLQKLMRKAREGVGILLKNGYTIDEIFQYDIPEGKMKEMQQIISDGRKE